MKINIKKSKKTLLLTLLLVLIVGITVVAITVTVIIDNNKNATSSSAQMINNGPAMSGVYRGKSRAELLKELKKKQINMNVNICPEILFKSGKQGSKGFWVVDNPITNTLAEQCQVILNREVIAVTPIIKPGQHIENISLSMPINAGNYSVTVNINYYNPATSIFTGRSEIKNVKIVVS